MNNFSLLTAYLLANLFNNYATCQHSKVNLSLFMFDNCNKLDLLRL